MDADLELIAAHAEELLAGDASPGESLAGRTALYAVELLGEVRRLRAVCDAVAALCDAGEREAVQRRERLEALAAELGRTVSPAHRESATVPVERLRAALD